MREVAGMVRPVGGGVVNVVVAVAVGGVVGVVAVVGGVADGW